MEAEDSRYYRSVALKLLKSIIENYMVKNKEDSNGLLLHGVYSKKTPYNTCAEAGVDECVIWGDYFYMEALQRVLNPDWKIYW